MQGLLFTHIAPRCLLPDCESTCRHIALPGSATSREPGQLIPGKVSITSDLQVQGVGFLRLDGGRHELVFYLAIKWHAAQVRQVHN